MRVFSLLLSVISIFLGGYAVWQTEQLKADRVYSDAVNFYSVRSTQSVKGAIDLLNSRLQAIVGRINEKTIADDLYNWYYNDVEGPLLDELRRLPSTDASRLYIEFTTGPDTAIVKETAVDIIEHCRRWSIQHPEHNATDIANLKEALYSLIKTSRRLSNEEFAKWLTVQL